MPRRTRDPGPSGVLLCDKPAGMTSHDVVAMVRRNRGGRAGHAGTLDPFASGLLTVLCGRATRLQRYLMALPKRYVAVARLGWRSSTGDPEGELEHTGRMPERLAIPTGTLVQRVPMTSATRVAGERLYRRAHRGESAERPEREVSVHSARLLEADTERARFEIECSAGTYVRTLIEALGDAYCEELRRTAVGPLEVVEAVGEPFDGEPLTPYEALRFLGERALTDDEAQRVAHGGRIPAEAAGAATEEAPGPPGALRDRRRLTYDGRLLAVARPVDGQLQPEVVLA